MQIEKYIREEAPHKHLIFVLNKCDLVPTGVAVRSFRSLFLQTFPLRSIVKSRLLPALFATSGGWFSLLQLWYIDLSSAALGLPASGRLISVMGNKSYRV